MADLAPNGMKVLDYAQVGLEQPPRTRILVQKGPAGIRFIDPPLAGTQLGRRVLLRFAWQMVIVLIVVPVFCRAWHLSRVGILISVAAVVALNGWDLLRYWFHSARRPTVIDVTARVMAATLPSQKRIVIPLSEIADIHASRPRRLIGVRGRVSSLVISAWGRRFWVVRYRDYAEVRWLARQLRLSTGRSPDRPGEPTVDIVAEMQESSEIEAAWSGPLPPMPEVGKDTDRGTRNTFGQFVSREYDNLGCAACLWLLVSIVIGMMISSWLVEDLMIRLQLGSYAYSHGLRSVPHHGFLLTNGKTLGRQYQALGMALGLVGLFTWGATALMIAIGINRFVEAIHARRRRRRKRSTQRQQRVP